MRTIIELPDDQIAALADLCRTEGISRAEAIRQAIAHYTRGRSAKAAATAFGLWRHRPIDSLDYERRLRNEWAGNRGGGGGGGGGRPGNRQRR